jgi:endo-1,4-beta-mannosidase
MLRFVAPWGPFPVGDTLPLPAWDGELHTRGVRLLPSDAETIAVDADGEPALVVARRGAGTVVTCAYPIELLLATVPDAHGPQDASWGIYAGLATLAGIQQVTGHPEVTAGELRGPSGTITVLTNHGSAAVAATATLPDGQRTPVELEPYGFALLEGRADASPTP